MKRWGMFRATAYHTNIHFIAHILVQYLQGIEKKGYAAAANSDLA